MKIVNYLLIKMKNVFREVGNTWSMTPLSRNWNQVLLGPICFKVNLECLKMLTTKRTTVELKLDHCLSESRNLSHFAEHSMIQIRLWMFSFMFKLIKRSKNLWKEWKCFSKLFPDFVLYSSYVGFQCKKIHACK